MKRFAWVVMFLTVGLFAYAGCGGPGSSDVNQAEDAEIADMDLQTMGGGAPEEGGEEAGGEEGGAPEEGGEETP